MADGCFCGKEEDEDCIEENNLYNESCEDDFVKETRHCMDKVLNLTHEQMLKSKASQAKLLQQLQGCKCGDVQEPPSTSSNTNGRRKRELPPSTQATATTSIWNNSALLRTRLIYALFALIILLTIWLGYQCSEKLFESNCGTGGFCIPLPFVKRPRPRVF